MPFQLPPLPYAQDALAPHISAETLDFHYNKHHAGYVTKLNGIAANTPLADRTLEEVIRSDVTKLPPGAYNCAAQTWNHTFYWNSLIPAAQASPSGEPSKDGVLYKQLVKDFGSFDAFKKKFSDAASGHFGSGWAWLVQDKATGVLKVVETHDAVCPLSTPDWNPLLTCDVWEHAYYIDYRNARPKYVENWWKLVNWSFAESNLKVAGKM